MNLTIIGLNHRTAPVDLREQLSLPADLAAKVLLALREDKALEEAVLLSTCNRTGLYCVPSAAGKEPIEGLFVRHVSAVKGAAIQAQPQWFYRHDGLDAVAHLFEVAGSLDSQIVGEHQILGQVKDAYRLAVDARMAGFLLSKSLHWAFRVGKRVQSETELGRGAASVALAAVELVGQIFSSLAGKRVLIVGAGRPPRRRRGRWSAAASRSSSWPTARSKAPSAWQASFWTTAPRIPRTPSGRLAARPFKRTLPSPSLLCRLHERR